MPKRAVPKKSAKQFFRNGALRRRFAANRVVWNASLMRHPVPQTLASRVGYPGLVVATGLGWLMLLDLSANGNFNNRYLALYHQGHLWLGMLALTVVAFRVTEDVGETLSRAWGLLALVDQHVRSTDPTLGGAVLWARVTSTDAGSAPRKASGGYSGRVSMVEATVECGVIAAVG